MIEIHIKVNGEGVIDTFNNIDCTLEETAVVVYRLEQLKQELLAKEFESDFYVEREEDEEDEEDEEINDE